MDANISAPRFMPGVPFENGSAMPPYPFPHHLHNQHPFPHPPPQPNPYSVANGQRFDANWLASLPPPPPPIHFPQAGTRPPFDASGHPMFPHIPFIPQTTQTPPQNAVAPPITPQERTPTPSKERAKDAVLAMVRADITYNDLVAEGIKVPLLNALFAELNIPLPKPAVEPAVILDPAMERKDRIAKLLAAKKNNSAAASPKEPVQPIEPITTPELAARKDTPSPVPAKQATRPDNRIDFSIPGLFMTSAEHEELLPPAPSLSDAEIPLLEHGTAIIESATPTVEEEPVLDSIVSEQLPVPIPDSANSPVRQPTPPLQIAAPDSKSLKRGPEAFAANVMPQTKRQLSMSQDVLPTNGPDKVADAVSGTIRSKVNQNILKDRMAALKADLLLKNSRKKALQDGMPVLNAEVQKTRERLQDNEIRLRNVRLEIDEKDAELTRLREEEIRLQDEVQHLKHQLTDGETGQQRFSKELTQLNDQIMADENASKLPQSSNFSIPSTTVRIEPPFQMAPATESDSYDIAPNDSSRTLAEPVSNYGQEDYAGESVAIQGSQMSVYNRPTETEYSPEQNDLDRQLNDEVAYTISQRLPAESDSATHLQIPDSRVASELVMATPSPEVESEQLSDDDDRMSIDDVDEVESVGSASMSDSGSDEYEPPVHLDLDSAADGDDADDYEPQEDNLASQESSNEAEGDDYEPAEQVNVLNVEALDVLRGTQEDHVFSTAPQPDNDMAMDASNSTTEAAALPSPPHPEWPLAVMPSVDVNTQELGAMALVEPLSNSLESVPSVPQFVPYSSPLSNMKQFRFNSQFNDLVKEGYRSLTYSHQIDKDVPLCPTELSGSVCTDGDCEEQHFSRFALTDDKILVQMSSANHIKDKAQRDRYLIGLKKVIADLRERGVKEFSEVANALATYRRDQAMSQVGLVA